MPVRNDRELKVYLSVYDSKGNEFDDASSLVIEWTSAPKEIGYFINKHTQVENYPGDGVKNGGKRCILVSFSFSIIMLHINDQISLNFQAPLWKSLFFHQCKF